MCLVCSVFVNPPTHSYVAVRLPPSSGPDQSGQAALLCVSQRVTNHWRSRCWCDDRPIRHEVLFFVSLQPGQLSISSQILPAHVKALTPHGKNDRGNKANVSNFKDVLGSHPRFPKRRTPGRKENGNKATDNKISEKRQEARYCLRQYDVTSPMQWKALWKSQTITASLNCHVASESSPLFLHSCSARGHTQQAATLVPPSSPHSSSPSFITCIVPTQPPNTKTTKQNYHHFRDGQRGCEDAGSYNTRGVGQVEVSTAWCVREVKQGRKRRDSTTEKISSPCCVFT